jgi:hypothetical protein
MCLLVYVNYCWKRICTCQEHILESSERIKFKTYGKLFQFLKHTSPKTAAFISTNPFMKKAAGSPRISTCTPVYSVTHPIRLTTFCSRYEKITSSYTSCQVFVVAVTQTTVFWVLTPHSNSMSSFQIPI